MFRHLFTTNVKMLLRTREVVFWAFLYPLVMAMLFHFAFGNLDKADAFSPVSIVVAAEKDITATPFYAALNAVSDIEGAAGQDDLFGNVSQVSPAQAEEMLQKGDIGGYFVYNGDEDVSLVVGGSGFGQTIAKSFLDTYLQTSATAHTLLTENPAAAQAIFADIGNRTEYFVEQQDPNRPVSTTVIYFYALLAMTCLMGSTVAVDEVIKIQANMSARAARVNVAPVPKFRMFLCNISAVLLFEITVSLVVLAFLMYVLGVGFGPRAGYVALTCALGAVSGVFMGTAISVGVKSQGLKYGVAIGGTIFASFLSGMMWPGMKYVVQTYLPPLAYLNPANLIADALYSLYYYDSLGRYAANMYILLALSAALCAATCLVLRRQSYASI